eukprot:CAMPEP_0181287902 /NCGR_PEP_ID=MMETSP1101-20121128/41_1 /TAXON_ID=46948 /ORGANISM="Rhodomonas abbreviata, Strain Caron Lab Isolate" /LENGTH=50 /DNA_ID=CAMNT_0023391977 /DNA_START=697 /DNA_END=846 /DNA_ORIENTATION=-
MSFSNACRRTPSKNAEHRSLTGRKRRGEEEARESGGASLGTLPSEAHEYG